jgi:murein DD-endopeptidase MepM/ murein hydrolase activator NlpD
MRAAIWLVLCLALFPPDAPAQRRQPGVPPPIPPPPMPHVPPLPDPSGWGTHVLAIARAPDGAIWVGTYGQGIYVLRPGASEWENLRPHPDGTRRAISWDIVHAFAFGPRRADVWYGTVGNGWGHSGDNGRTWRNWTYADLGPRWQYVAPNGIVVKGDTVFVATADGIRWSTDRGSSWNDVSDSGPGALPSRYVLTMTPARGGDGLWVSNLRGIGVWRVQGAYRPLNPSPAVPMGPRIRSVFTIEAPLAVAPAVLGGERCAGGLRPERRARRQPAYWQCMGVTIRDGPPGGRAIRAMAGCDGVLCGVASSAGAFYGARLGLQIQESGTARARDVYAVLAPPREGNGDTLFGTACGLLGQQPAACLTMGDSIGVLAPAPPRHTWFTRPISLTDQPYIDQTYRYGSTMGGNFQEHQGVEFNNPAGTPVFAVEGGLVVHAGPAERGALTVAIRHDSVLVTDAGRFFLFSVYYHNSRLLVREGQRVQRGQEIARVGATGRATNDHLHLEIHASPVDSPRVVVDSTERFPPYTRNPELWIEPLAGTGIVAGQVWDEEGRPVRQARIYGLVKPEPQETPFSFAETYGDRAHPDPVYNEHFAVSDVPPGEYVLGVDIGDRRVFRRVRVEAGRVTWVEFR